MPTAKIVSASPAHCAPSPPEVAANSGTSETRTPKLAQPLANPATSAARNALSVKASRTVRTGAGVLPGGGRSDAPEISAATTPAAMSSATA